MSESVANLIQEAQAEGGSRFTTDIVRIKDIGAQALSCALCGILNHGIKLALEQLNLTRKSPVAIHRKLTAETTWFGFETEWQTLVDVGFELFCDEGTSLHWAGMTHKRHLGKRVDFDSCQFNIQYWLQECELHHSQCRAPSNMFLPTRVIDVGSTINPSLRLVETTDCTLEAYVALSHCWGDPSTVPKLTGATLAAYTRTIPSAILSKTFQHAIDITRGLGVRFLWIDALCIIQDDAEDWAHEAARMGDVYSQATITIASATAKDGSEGCFYDRRGGQEHKVEAATPQGNIDIWIRLPVDHYFLKALTDGTQAFDARDRYPLATRKWIFQERILSRRVLYFTAHELIWECREDLTCECNAADFWWGHVAAKPKLGLPHNAISQQVICGTPEKQNALLARWAVLAYEYSTRDLTYITDMLPALSGVARIFSQAGLGRYYAGIWESDLPLALAWQAVYLDEQSVSSVKEYCAPSWSWTSSRTRTKQPTAATVAERQRQLEYCCVNIISIAAPPAGADEFGKVLQHESILEIEAPASHLLFQGLSSESSALFEGFPDAQSFAAAPMVEIAELVGQRLWVVCLERRQPEGKISIGNTTGCSILLRPCGSDGLYERCGQATPYFDRDGAFSTAIENAGRRRFRII